MLSKLAYQEAQAFLSLRNNSDYMIVCNYLERQIKEINERNCAEHDKVHTRWNQGAVQALGDLLKKPDQAAKFIKS